MLPADAQISQQDKEDSLPIAKISERTCGLAVTIAAFALHSYYVRELLVSVTLFSVGFLLLALLVFTVILLWWASEQLADWAGPASRKAMALSRRAIAAHAKL
ncbi:MAG: hypothetical protein WBH24_13730 [Candidatus Acidiferrum sp.]